MEESIRRELEDLIRYYGELQRRLAQAGVKDIASLLAAYDQIRRALDAVSAQEISWARERATGLVDALVKLNGRVQALRRLKVAIEQNTPSGAPHRSRSPEPGRGGSYPWAGPRGLGQR